jgi:ABC-type nitrate/sulfonate/bicarbonate transport system substrate-binding protein
VVSVPEAQFHVQLTVVAAALALDTLTIVALLMRCDAKLLTGTQPSLSGLPLRVVPTQTWAAMASALHEHVHVRFTRFSAFYTPLLFTLKSKDLKDSGIKLTYDRATPELSVDAGIADGSVHVAQSAPALSFKSALSGQPPVYRHFALMNNRDGFFLAARKGSTAAVQQPQPGSTAAVQGSTPGTWQWRNLEGSTALIDHFFQPLALFRTALRCQGVDEKSINIIDAGSPDQIEAAFRAGKGDVLHMQGPAPQHLELEVSKVSASFEWPSQCFEESIMLLYNYIAPPSFPVLHML